MATTGYSLLRDFYYIPKLTYSPFNDKEDIPLLVGDKVFLSIFGILSTPIYGIFSLYDDMNRVQAYYDKSLYPKYKDYYEQKVFPYSLTHTYKCKDPNIMPKDDSSNSDGSK